MTIYMKNMNKNAPFIQNGNNFNSNGVFIIEKNFINNVVVNKYSNYIEKYKKNKIINNLQQQWATGVGNELNESINLDYYINVY